MKDLDFYILNLIYDYLQNSETGLLKCINKKFYKNIINYQKHKIKNLLKNNYYSSEIKNIIKTNHYNYLYICDSEILEKLTIKPIVYIIGKSPNDINLGSIHKIYYNNYFQEYRSYHVITSHINYFNKLMDMQLLYLGGELLIIMYNKIKVYNLLTNMWITYNIDSNDDYIKCNKRCCIYNDEIYVTQSYWIGENENFEHKSFPLGILFKNNTHKYTLKLFNEKTEMIKCRKGHAMIAFKNKLWIAGGRCNLEFLQCVETFDFNTQIWSEEDNTMNRKRLNFKLEVIDNILYAIGGDIEISDFSITIEKYDYYSKKWIIITEKNILNYYSTFVLNNKIMFFTKNLHKSINVFDIYDIKNDLWTYKELKECIINNDNLFTISI